MHVNPEVAEWLHEQAEAYFNGDVEKAMNHWLGEALAAWRYWAAQGVDPFRPPTDPWARLRANLPPVGQRAPKPPPGQ